MIKPLILCALLGFTLRAQTVPFVSGPFEPLPEQMSLEQSAEAHRLSVEIEAREYVKQMNAFAEAWNAFAKDYSSVGAVNVRKARAMKKAWTRVSTLLPR